MTASETQLPIITEFLLLPESVSNIKTYFENIAQAQYTLFNITLVTSYDTGSRH